MTSLNFTVSRKTLNDLINDYFRDNSFQDKDFSLHKQPNRQKEKSSKRTTRNDGICCCLHQHLLRSAERTKHTVTLLLIILQEHRQDKMTALQVQQSRSALQTITNNGALHEKQHETTTKRNGTPSKRPTPAVVPKTYPHVPSPKTRSEDSCEKDVSFASDDTEAAFRSVCLSRICGSYDDYDDDDDDDSQLQVWTVDDFEYMKRLGQGGSATVYAARERQSGHMVALKVQEILEVGGGGDFYDDGEGEALYEVDIHDSVNEHACIVRMHDYFFSGVPFGPPEENPSDGNAGTALNEDDDETADQDKRYLIMILQLCTGGSLFDIIRDAPMGYLSEPQASAFLWDAMDALDYVHQQGIIHCDIKPLNFLVHDGTCMLADFGMGVHNDSRVIVGGSPMYMAPEHLKAWRYMTCNFDHKTDIYSLGVILFEMLVGYLPYEVIQDSKDVNGATMDSMYASLCAAVDNLDLDNETDEGEMGVFRPPILDLRKLEDHLSDAPIYIPPPIFPDFMSTEAQDLITSLMELNPQKRLSLEDARRHAWFQKFL